MPYSARMQGGLVYSLFFAPRGNVRMADLGMQIAQQYLSPFDKLIGVVGSAGAGKSMLIKGMFPGLELTNDDEGVNVRPLPLMNIDDTGFYTAHTYHMDVRFESAFTQMHVLADAVSQAVHKGKRVVVEHFDLLYPVLGRNAHLLLGVGEEVIITRPTLFGPEPQEVADVVFKSIPFRRMAHTAEDLCEHCLCQYDKSDYEHSDIRHGFILSFENEPDIDFDALEKNVLDMIKADLPVSYLDDDHILIGEIKHHCTGPRMHMRSTGEIKHFRLLHEFLREPITNRYLLVGTVGEDSTIPITALNNIEESVDTFV